jgi:hypothetical protein
MRAMVAEKKAKRCKECNELRRVDEYYKNPATADGLEAKCRYCRVAAANASQRTRVWRKAGVPDDLIDSMGKHVHLNEIKFLIAAGYKYDHLKGLL